ncbi:MAG: LemA family protein [Verrucomicrobia bacterium]|nr:LemA family protein [Verrucomicrobiota bacterium]
MTLIGIVGLATLWAVVVLALGKRRLQALTTHAATVWSRVQAALEQRHELGRQMVANAARPDDPPILALHDALTQAEFLSGFAMKAQTENQLSRTLREALAVGGDERFAEAATALPGVFEAVQRAASDYNAQVRNLNAALERQSIVAGVFHYEPREEFCLEAMEGEKS